MGKVVVVAIAGPSGSGKSYLAGQLQVKLQQTDFAAAAVCIQEDSYYRDQSNLTFDQRELTNYDHPDAFEHELLVEHLQDIRDGKSVEVPQYDFSRHNRGRDRTCCAASPVVIVEGILLLHDSNLRELCDIKIFVDTPIETCLARRIARDTQERSRSKQSVRDQFEKTVLPMYKQFVHPTKKSADIIAHGTKGNDLLLEILANHLGAVLR